MEGHKGRSETSQEATDIMPVTDNGDLDQSGSREDYKECLYLLITLKVKRMFEWMECKV